VPLIRITIGTAIAVIAFGIVGYAATRPGPVPPDQYLPPAWAPPDQAQALKKSYSQDYRDDIAAPDETPRISVRQPKGEDYRLLPLLYVSEEDTEAVREQLARGLEPDLVVRADGKIALRKYPPPPRLPGYAGDQRGWARL
jgi:hypothetical protein